LVIFTILTVFLTRRAPGLPLTPTSKPSLRPKLALGFLICLIGLVFIGSLALQGHCIISWPAYCHFYTHTLSNRFPVGDWIFFPTEIFNPIVYLVIPMAVLLLLGSRLRELGFAQGWKSWRITTLWAILPFGLLAWRWYSDSTTGLIIAQSAVSNGLQNGLFEEFLFRGALMTRLMIFFDATWSVVLAALAFGFWHVGANLSQTHGAVLPALSLCVLQQGVFGIAMGIVFIRTRNLLASSVFHVVGNMLG
ncbi:MAG: CPBP family intramembrane metalloprotease, partial [Sinobacteraceae bacterium]|nr:CPBP family intramembrane metalloprotease [Nevskiaceae bacterium]